MAFQLSRSTRLIIIILISFSFFIAEISAGFHTRSLALVADAFHYLNDLLGFIAALVAIRLSERANSPKHLSFRWQRAPLLAAFFNGVFLFALGVSIFLQSIGRFVFLEEVQNPEIMLIVGCVGLALNLLSGAFVHEHAHASTPTPVQQHNEDDQQHELQPMETQNGDEQQPEVLSTSQRTDDDVQPGTSSVHHNHVEHRHSTHEVANPGHDLGMMGVFLHVLGDAANNLGVIIAAAVIWRANYQGRFYADPGVSMGIAILIFLSSLPLIRKTSLILLQGSPVNVDMDDVQHDILMTPGVISVHELHVWRLTQQKSIASMHIVVSKESLEEFEIIARQIIECLHAYDIHSATIQPEVHGQSDVTLTTEAPATNQEQIEPETSRAHCKISCGPSCNALSCCG